MNIEKYTERARGFIQSAQSLAVRDGHQQFSPLHMLKVLLDDSEGLAGGLIDRAGGNSRAILKATEEALNKLPKVSGSGAGQVYLAPDLARSNKALKAGILGELTRYKSRILPYMPGRRAADKERAFLVIYSTMLGAIGIARILPDPAARASVLSSARDFLLRSF